MGKQTNYWMDFESFLLLAQKAVSLGCTIVKEAPDSDGVMESKDIALITPYEKGNRIRYYFHLPEAGNIRTHIMGGKTYLDSGYSASGNTVIEAGYSEMQNKVLRRGRLFCISGYYDEHGNYFPRPDCLTKVYDALARYVKKIAPRTDLTDTYLNLQNGNDVRQFIHQSYITKACLDKVNKEGYVLSQQ